MMRYAIIFLVVVLVWLARILYCRVRDGRL